MNENQYLELRVPCETIKTISSTELWDKTPRTMLFGMTKDSNTWHLYMNEQKQFWLSIYDGGHISGKYFGSKIDLEVLFDMNLEALYPESCDYIFTRLIWQKGFNLPFYNFNSRHTNYVFYGKRAPQDIVSKEIIVK